MTSDQHAPILFTKDTPKAGSQVCMLSAGHHDYDTVKLPAARRLAVKNMVSFCIQRAGEWPLMAFCSFSVTWGLNW